MQPLSDPPHTGSILLQRFLLTATFLTCWHLPPSIGVSTEAEPPTVHENMNVYLHPRDVSFGTLIISWFKGRNHERESLIASYSIIEDKTTTGPLHNWKKEMFKNGTLKIRQLAKEDSGDYLLVLVNREQQETSAYITLTVYPQITDIKVTGNYNWGREYYTHIAIYCNPRYENTSITWLLNGKEHPLGKGTQLVDNNYTLLLNGVIRKWTGNYQCVATNPANTKKAEGFLMEVHYGPDKPTVSPNVTEFMAGSDIHLRCEADGYKRIWYRWHFQKKMLTNQSDLYIKGATKAHSGRYKCRAVNAVTDDENHTEVTITVYELLTRPEIQVDLRPYRKGDILNMTCHGNGTRISFSWWRDEDPLELEPGRMNLSKDNRNIVIEMLIPEDSGIYTCLLSNDTDSIRSHPFQLIVNNGNKRMTTELTTPPIQHIQQEQQGKRHPSKRGIIAMLVQGLLVLLVLMFVIGFLLRSRRKQGKDQNLNEIKEEGKQTGDQAKPTKVEEKPPGAEGKQVENVKPTQKEAKK